MFEFCDDGVLIWKSGLVYKWELVAVLQTGDKGKSAVSQFVEVNPLRKKKKKVNCTSEILTPSISASRAAERKKQNCHIVHFWCAAADTGVRRGGGGGKHVVCWHLWSHGFLESLTTQRNRATEGKSQQYQGCLAVPRGVGLYTVPRTTRGPLTSKEKAQVNKMLSTIQSWRAGIFLRSAPTNGSGTIPGPPFFSHSLFFPLPNEAWQTYGALPPLSARDKGRKDKAPPRPGLLVVLSMRLPYTPLNNSINIRKK